MEKIMLEPCSLRYFNTETMRDCHKYALRLLESGRAVEVTDNRYTFLKLKTNSNTH